MRRVLLILRFFFAEPWVKFLDNPKHESHSKHYHREIPKCSTMEILRFYEVPLLQQQIIKILLSGIKTIVC